jgi:Putative adhesin
VQVAQKYGSEVLPVKLLLRKGLGVSILLITIVAVVYSHDGGTSREIFPVKMKGVFANKMEEQTEMTEMIKKSFPVSPGGSLTVKSSIGTVEVQAVDSNNVNIELTRQIKAANKKELEQILKDLQLDFVHNGSNVEVLIKLPEEWDWNKIKRVRFDMKITIPLIYNVKVRTVGVIQTNDLRGHVELSTSGFRLTTGNVRGSVDLSSAGGAINAGDVNGPATVTSAGGAIRIGNIDGDFNVRSSGGSINAGRVDGRVTAHSAGGYIRIKEVTNAVEAISQGGEVSTYISRQPQSDSSFVTAGGSVNLRLAESVKLSLEADLGSGSVLSDYPLPRREPSSSIVKGDINGGGPKITVRTAAGNLTLRKWDPANPETERRHSPQHVCGNIQEAL